MLDEEHRFSRAAKAAPMRASASEAHFCFSAHLLIKIQFGPAYVELAVRKVANPDVFELHVALPAGVQLQGNFSVEATWVWDR